MSFEFGDPDIFDKIYENSYWGKGSGGGSSPEATQPYKVFLEDFIRQNILNQSLTLVAATGSFPNF